jgi:hypothetical protein
MYGFDPSNPVHVKWLKGSFDIMEEFMDPSGTKNTRKVLDFMNDNPFDLVVSKTNVMELAETHMALGCIYAKAVLQGSAYIITRPSR